MKSTLRLALAAAAAQDIAGFTADFTLDLVVVIIGEEITDEGFLLLQALLALMTDAEVCLLVDRFETFKAGDIVTLDEIGEVQCTGGLGKAVGAGAS